ncbi:nonsense-mediated mRNA decay factor SMG5-like [Cherax quadricarinatus]|uniref:nonsense-mediated mRNA decay factor SMG5-like n=1 Tax=Cherax quadricarinatus TaxID=27406 RepID=UPI00387E765F
MYLVPDATVLINHLQAIKMLLSKPTHIIIIPQAAIDLLDQQKRESLGARDAIRWLEIKFRHGSRFIKAQCPHERTRLPLIKYPKRKDKEAWEWYQIVECCHYLSAQVQQNSITVKTASDSTDCRETPTQFHFHSLWPHPSCRRSIGTH